MCLHSSQKQNSEAVFVNIPAKKKTQQLYLFTFLPKTNSAAVFVYISPKTQQLYLFTLLPKLSSSICLHFSLNSAAVFVYIPPKNKKKIVFATNSGFLISMALQRFSPSDCKL